MIPVYNVLTHVPEEMEHPDDTRHRKVTVDGQMINLWQLFRGEKRGCNKLVVYRSSYLMKLLWRYKTGEWVLFDNYDEEKEDNDKAYAEEIDKYMSQSASSYPHMSITMTTTTTTTTTRFASPKRNIHDDFERRRKVQKASDSFGEKQKDDKSLNDDLKDKEESSDHKEANSEKSDDKSKKEESSDDEEDDRPLHLLVKERKKEQKKEQKKTTQQPSDGTNEDKLMSLISEIDALKKEKMDLECERDKKELDIQQLKMEKEKAEDEKKNAVRLHENYKARNRNERFNERKNHSDAMNVLIQEKDAIEQRLNYERVQMQKKYNAAKAVVNGSSSLEPVVGAYNELIAQTKQAYLDIRDAKIRAHGQCTTTKAKYAFKDKDQWWDIDIAVEKELDKLVASPNLSHVNYTYGSHSYKATLYNGSDQTIFALQKNLSYYTERFIYHNAKRSGSSSSSSSVLTAEDKEDILFGNSIIPLPTDWVSTLLERFNFNEDHYFVASRELAELAELFNTFSHNFKYTNGSKHQTDLYVKPISLFNWLTIAKARKYTYMRLVMHGASSKQKYDGIRDDPLGMDLQHAGMQGQSWGNGFYFGLSDHVTITYNRGSQYKEGTAIMALVLTHEKLHQHYSSKTGSMSTFNSNQQSSSQSFSLSSPNPAKNNCIVVHEGSLILILGKVVTL